MASPPLVKGIPRHHYIDQTRIAIGINTQMWWGFDVWRLMGTLWWELKTWNTVQVSWTTFIILSHLSIPGLRVKLMSLIRCVWLGSVGKCELLMCSRNSVEDTALARLANVNKPLLMLVFYLWQYGFLLFIYFFPFQNSPPPKRNPLTMVAKLAKCRPLFFNEINLTFIPQSTN